MSTPSRLAGEHAFTLTELMVVLGVLAILVAVASASYQVFLKKAKTVEAETALLEVNRLENLYYEEHSQYSSDLQAIGYAPTPPLKYYTVEVQLTAGAGGVAYKATAKPIGSEQIESLVLARYEDGTTVLEKVASSGTGGTFGGGSSPDSGSGGSGEGPVAENGSGPAGGGKGSSTGGRRTVIQKRNTDLPRPDGGTGPAEDGQGNSDDTTKAGGKP